MIQIKGNIFDPTTYRIMNPPTRGWVPVSWAPNAICVTTNAMTKLEGNRLVGVMGRGIAKQAADIFPTIAQALAEQLLENGNHTQIIQVTDDIQPLYIVALPTKTHWRLPSDPALVNNSLSELFELANHWNWQRVVLPRPGCGLGGLDYESQVKPLLQLHLDDRFAIITP